MKLVIYRLRPLHNPTQNHSKYLSNKPNNYSLVAILVIKQTSLSVLDNVPI